MKKKINIQFVVTVAIAIAITAVLSTAVFYETFKKEMLENLKSYAHVIKNSALNIEQLEMEDFDNLRITIISTDGTVIYDNNADAADMSNHGDRPEVENAFSQGEGEAIRRSSTLDKSTFYYAITLENGDVLRVAKEAGSIWSVFLSAFPLIGLIVLLTLAVCFMLTHFLTRALVKPIEEIANNMDDLDNVEVYKELQPFVTTIKKQHEDIIKSALMRREFTANVSHELKTPLTSISGYSELIENGMAGEEDAARFAGEIHHSASRLLSLINDILRLSELDSGDLKVVFEEVNLYDIADSCVQMLELHAQDHKVKLHFEGEAAMVRGSRNMLEEVVYNLCDNAIRYNKDGGNVWVRVFNKAVTVTDDGIGISPENQQRVFERFYRVDKSRSKKTGGTGLGLAIVKHIVEQHNAKIELVSQVNVGTTIKVSFP